MFISETQKPYLAMLFTQFIYAGMALLSKAALDVGMSPYVFVVYRQAFASLVLLPFTFLLERKNAPPMTYSIMFKIFLASLFGMTLSMNLYYIALNYTSATFAAASTNTIPAITFIVAAILRMESISMKSLFGVAKVLGSIICLSGALLVALDIGPPIEFINWYSATHKEVSSLKPSPVEHNSKLHWVKGALIMLSANTAWSLWLIMQGPIMKIYPAKMHLTNLQCFFSCILSAIWAIAFDRNLSSWKLGWNVQLVSIAYCGIVVTGITYWLQVWCIEKKGPVFTSMFTPLALLITAIVSAFLWKETMHWGSVGGALLLVGGLFGVLWGKKKEDCPEKETKTQSKEIDRHDVVLECITHQ
ncbi:Wat1-related protein [Thalictrum thalictroides]|uniref:WAT1-related protein n=1 Tax=Thalictrum thalictroides TaxID=46969 RepID=A0A7J6UY79_THATH|nr:Wat1-related protein [Thalictrum thalictroides]